MSRTDTSARQNSPQQSESLAEAVKANDLALVADLLESGADPNRKDQSGYPPLALAAGLGNNQMVEVLLAHGADPLLLDTRMGSSALHKAAQGGVIEVARLLLENGAFIDQQAPTHGHTPLIDAVWHKRAEMSAFLVERGAILSIRTHYGATALDIARRDGLKDIVDMLETAENRLRAKIEGQSLHQAAQSGDLATVRRLISESADVNEKSPVVGGFVDGHTPLLLAAVEGHEEVVRELLEAGADPRIVDHLMKATPGHKSGYMGHAGVARLLVEHGVLELDAQGPYNGYTALHDAVWHGHTEAAKVFLEAGARTDLRGLDGRTPLEMAHDYGYEDIVALITGDAENS